MTRPRSQSWEVPVVLDPRSFRTPAPQSLTSRMQGYLSVLSPLPLSPRKRTEMTPGCLLCQQLPLLFPARVSQTQRGQMAGFWDDYPKEAMPPSQ